MPRGINEQAVIDEIYRIDNMIRGIHGGSEDIDGSSEETKALITNLVNSQG